MIIIEIKDGTPHVLVAWVVHIYQDAHPCEGDQSYHDDIGEVFCVMYVKRNVGKRLCYSCFMATIIEEEHLDV